MSNFEQNREGDREWLAFRYIAGELDDEQVAAFESELETSQVAREAVARAVELSQAIALAQSHEVEPLEVCSRGSGGRQSFASAIGWLGAAAVAASVAAMVWWNTRDVPGTPSGPQIADAAAVWSGINQAEILPEDVAREQSPQFEAALAPSWMTAGVISLSGGKIDDDTDADGKPDESWDDEIWEN